MSVVEQGLIDLDAPIGSYLPAFTGEKASITTRQLLAFTSGLEEDATCVGAAGWTLQTCAAAIAAMLLRAAPGSQFRYGSTHLAVAAAIAEVRSNTAFAALLQQRITEPLGMTATRFRRVLNPNPAGGAISTCDDYERFVRMLWAWGEVDGVRVLTRASVEQMQSDQTAGAPIVVASAIRKALGSRYGFGEWYDRTGPAPDAYEVSSPGANGFFPWIDRARDVYGIYSVEYRGEEANAGGWDVKALVGQAVDASG